MTHPEEFLADYVDGSLGEDERALVDAHLQACATCFDEVELSRAAVTALRTLEEEPVPLGVTGLVLAEAGRRFERRRSALWSRVQWAAGAAAAAALVLVVAINLGGPGENQEATDRAGADAGAADPQDGVEESTVAAEAAVPGLEIQREVNYDGAGVRSLAEVTAERSRDDTLAAPNDAPAPDGFQEPSAALDCLRTSGAPVDEPTTDTLVRLIQARYEDTPAYFAVFLETPGAGQPPDTVVVWVTARDDCTRILDAASLAI